MPSQPHTGSRSSSQLVSNGLHLPTTLPPHLSFEQYSPASHSVMLRHSRSPLAASGIVSGGGMSGGIGAELSTGAGAPASGATRVPSKMSSGAQATRARARQVRARAFMARQPPVF